MGKCYVLHGISSDEETIQYRGILSFFGFFFCQCLAMAAGTTGNSNIPLLVGDAFYIGWENAVAFCYFWIPFKFWWTLEPGNSSQCLPAIRKMW